MVRFGSRNISVDSTNTVFSVSLIHLESGRLTKEDPGLLRRVRIKRNKQNEGY